MTYSPWSCNQRVCRHKWNSAFYDFWKSISIQFQSMTLALIVPRLTTEQTCLENHSRPRNRHRRMEISPSTTLNSNYGISRRMQFDFATPKLHHQQDENVIPGKLLSFPMFWAKMKNQNPNSTLQCGRRDELNRADVNTKRMLPHCTDCERVGVCLIILAQLHYLVSQQKIRFAFEVFASRSCTPRTVHGSESVALITIATFSSFSLHFHLRLWWSVRVVAVRIQQWRTRYKHRCFEPAKAFGNLMPVFVLFIMRCGAVR